MPVGVKAKTLAARDLEGGFIGVCLDLDGAVVGVVVAKGGGGEDEEESKEGDEEGEVELEGDGVVVGFGGWETLFLKIEKKKLTCKTMSLFFTFFLKKLF